MKKLFAVLAVVTLAIAAPAQASANESNNQVSSEQGSVDLAQKAQESIVRYFELAILEDNAGLQNLEKEVKAYIATLSMADQEFFMQAGNNCMERIGKIADKVIYLTDRLVAAITLNDQAVIKSVDKEGEDYVNSLSESDQAIFERFFMAYSKRLEQKK